MPTDFRPAPFGDRNLDQAFRVAFDNLYELRTRLQNLQTGSPSSTTPTAPTSTDSQAISGGITQSLSQAAVIYGTHAQRAVYTAMHYAGQFYAETDRLALYYSNGFTWMFAAGASFGSFETRYSDLTASDAGLTYRESSRSSIASVVPSPIYEWDGANWIWQSGEFARTQAQLAALATTLTANDAGALVVVTDYAHIFQWQGAGWAYAPDDSMDAGCTNWGPQPLAGVWYPYDGAAHNVLKSDGTLLSVATINVNAPGAGNQVALFTGGWNTTPVAATAPTWDAAAKTDDESTHTHAVAQTSITTVAGATAVDTGNPTGAGSAHSHALSNANAKIKAPSPANGGLGAYYQLSAWLRA